MFASLELRSTMILGTAAGKPLFCLLAPPLPGSAPVPGVYHIHPPVHDAIFGLVALMVPAGLAPTAGIGKSGGVAGKGARLPGGVSAKVERPGGVSAKFERPGGVSAKVERPGGVSAKFEWPGGVSAKASDLPGGVSAKFEGPTGVSSKVHVAADCKVLPGGIPAPAFVLSGKPIPGRHCLVIQSNFAGLMDALRIAGGAAIRVA